MVKNSLLFAGLTLFVVLTHAADANFQKQLMESSPKYLAAANSSEARQWIKQGKRSLVDARLKSLVEDGKKSAVDYFMIGNMLYRVDVAASEAYMLKAEQLLPNEPLIQYERAMHEQRAGRCKDALRYYDKALASDLLKGIPVGWAYVTQCQLVVGNYQAAKEAWKKADFSKHHTAIEEGMYEIFATHNSSAKRELKFAEASSGSVDGICELLDLDANWETDWWNVGPKRDFLEYDTSLAKSQSKVGAGLCATLANGTTKAQLTPLLETAGYWGTKSNLPASPALAYMVVNNLTKLGIAEPAQVLAQYESQLQAQHKADPANIRTLDVLAFLYSSTGSKDKLATLDRHGWKVLHQQKYAESYMLGKSSTDADYGSELEQALAEFPNSARISRLAVKAHSDSPDKFKYMMRFTAAQFANARNHMGEGLRLSDYMAALEAEMQGARRQ
jgi:tetratricopeptide (TPR) repeat protein